MNHETAIVEIGLYATADLVKRTHHCHGTGIAIIGKGFSYFAGGFEFLVLEQGNGFFKCWLRAKPAALHVNMSRSDRTYFIRPSVA